MFEIDRLELQKLLEILLVGVEKKRNELMALRGIRIKAKDGRLSMASTNLALSIKIVGVPLLKQTEDIDTVIAADRLYSIIRASTVPKLKFKFKDSQVTLYADGQSKINVYNPKEFPDIHVVAKRDKPILALSAAEFISDLGKAVTAVSKDKEHKVHLTGVCINGDFYATDAKRMIHISRLGPQMNSFTILPSVAEVLSKFSINEGDEISIYAVEEGGLTNVVFELGNVRIGSQTFSTPFPIDSVSKIIAETKARCKIRARVKRNKLMEVLNRAALFEDAHSTADLRFSKEGFLEVRCIMMDKSGEEYRERLDCLLKGKTKFSLIINFRELQLMLNTMNDKNVIFSFNAPDKPFYIKSKDGTLEFISVPLRRV